MSAPNPPAPRLYVSSSSADDSPLLRRVRERLELRLGDQVDFQPAASANSEDLTAIAESVQESGAVFVLIGPGWSVPPETAGSATDADRERIKAEVTAAVAADRPVLPVLLGTGTRAPSRTELAPALEPLAGRLFGRIHEDEADRDLDVVLRALTVRLPGLSLAPSPPSAGPEPVYQSAAADDGGVAVNIGQSMNGSKIVGRDDYSDNSDHSDHSDHSVNSKKLMKFGGIGAALVAVAVVLIVLHNQAEQPASSSDSDSSTTLITPDGGSTSDFAPDPALDPGTGAAPESQSPSTDSVTASSSSSPSPSPVSTTTTSSPPPAAFKAGADGITGDSRCSDFLVAPQDVQYQAAERVAIAMNFTEATSDPFIVQSTEYACGQNLNVKLATLMWYAKENSIG